MQRYDIIEKIGRKYLISNIENDEFSYQCRETGQYRKREPA